MSKRETLEDIAHDDAQDPVLIAQLAAAKQIREFASQALKLPNNGSYRAYVDLGRDNVTWNVYAASEYSMEPVRWCFPFAGCVHYRGYFEKQDAQLFADQLRKKGLDVYVGGATAYSTLGWFDDPLLNTMMHRGEAVMAGIIFHELAHQRVYISDDTEFNEGFAVAVQQEGAIRWLQQHRSESELQAYQQTLERERQFLELVAQARESLEALYRDAEQGSGKSIAKKDIIDAMRSDYQRLKKQWGGYEGYDRWFDGPLNNAQLISLAIYRDLVPAFKQLLVDCDSGFERFYEQVSVIGALEKEQRVAELRSNGECDRSTVADSN